ncbi:two-component sensor histidine kinase [Cellulomonas gelida]|uniref:Oxygen sensor histidine kinase NreB n=1 Tax=Cellulomonas gelida TaxID=1712 RepID=A0A4Y3KPQ4_9CELL|nr:two-component sensor histidine kinase [Cellulomonas gelida]GGL21837.1 two-component sensor histidine kinase [Cellulomonas gelida]
MQHRVGSDLAGLSDVSTDNAVGGRAEFWRGSMRAWDLAFWILVAISAAFAVPTAESAGAALASLAGFVVLVVAYQLLGRRGARLADARLTQSYLGVLVLVTTYETAAVQMGIVLLFIAYSHIWFFALSRWQGLAWTVALTLGIIGATALQVEATPADLPQIVGQATVGLLFSIALGLWITHVSEQSEVRAELLEDLRATQAALAASHHAEGVHAERARLAQEIHDTLAQGFTSVVMLAQTSSAELDAGRAEQARERLAQIEAVARDNLAEARALVAAFSPPALDDGLAAALRRLGDQLHTQTGLEVTVDAHDVEVPQDVAVALLRAAQESLANVRRHADARHVRLALHHASAGTPGASTDAGGDAPASVELEVVDDGRGVREDDVEGTGLRGMRERARVVGGDFRIDGTPGAGTRVTMRLPVPHQDARTETHA